MTTREASNELAAKSRKILDRSASFNEPDAAELSADLAALGYATLALVEQQRIANIIALSARGYALDDELAEVANEAQSALVYVDTTTGSQINGPDEIIRPRDDIKKGLGL